MNLSGLDLIFLAVGICIALIIWDEYDQWQANRTRNSKKGKSK